MNMPKPIENFDAVEKATFEKTFALAAEKLEECCKQSGIGEFVKTRVFYDPDCFPRQNICPMLEVYHEGNEEGHTYGLNTEEDVSEYIKER